MSSPNISPTRVDNLLFQEFIEHLETHSAIWIPDEQEGWIEAEVASHELMKGKRGDDRLILEINSKHDSTKKKITCKSIDSTMPCARNTTLADNLDDLVQLSYLNEPSVLHAIKQRYLLDSIYTYSGLVLVAMNPYKNIDHLYSHEEIVKYAHLQDKSSLAPHVYAVAENAYRSMLRDDRDQSIIISGESGAGKTVSARHVMRYFADVKKHTTSSTKRETLDNEISSNTIMNDTTLSDDTFVATSQDVKIEGKVLSTNPILESFGNAKTSRNDNSSRFGKYIQLHFNRDDIVGASIRTYLLEKSRVVYQAEGERNYHVFYQMIAGKGAFPDIIPNYLKKQYRYVNQTFIDGVDDARELKILVASMRQCGFTDEILKNIFIILTGILHWGDVDFVSDENDYSTIEDGTRNDLELACKCLGIDQSNAERWLTCKLLVTSRETVEAKLNVNQARTTRDSVAKLLYTLLFNYIVDHLNEILEPTKPVTRFIGVLDIYGFEKFGVNSFEQFCINYANERLQSEFTKHVFKAEQELYSQEDIQWKFINFADNQPCIDLIEGKSMGIIALLDEECRFPSGTDKSFQEKILSVHANDSYLQPSRFEDGTFVIKHFAYDVPYTAEGFLDKNRDALPMDLVQLLAKSQNAFISVELMTLYTEASGSLLSSPVREGKKRSRQGSAGKQGIAVSFKHSLSSLMSIIAATHCHYIRCIKPNEQRESNFLDSGFVLQQLRACGIIETIRISAAGYPARWTFTEFAERYKFLCSEHTTAALKNTTKDGDKMTTKNILESLELSTEQYQLGRTRIFLRVGILTKLEGLLTRRKNNASIVIQSTFKMSIAMNALRQARLMTLTLQSAIRSWFQQMYLIKLRQTFASLLIQRAYRSDVDHKCFYRTKVNINKIQVVYHGLANKREFSSHRMNNAVITIQKVYKTLKNTNLHKVDVNGIKMIQAAFHRVVAIYDRLKLRQEAVSNTTLRQKNESLQERLETTETELLKYKNQQQTLELELSKLQQETTNMTTEIIRLKELAEQKPSGGRFKGNVQLETENKRLISDNARLQNIIDDLSGRLEGYRYRHQNNVRKPTISGQDPIIVHVQPPPINNTDKLCMDTLLGDEKVFDELRRCITEDVCLPVSEDDDMLYFPAYLLEHWTRLAFHLPDAQTRFGIIVKDIKHSLEKSTDDLKCAFWVSNMICLSKKSQLKTVKDESMNLSMDILDVWTKDLCDWFSDAAINAILDYQGLPGYVCESSTVNGKGTYIGLFASIFRKRGPHEQEGKIIGNPDKSIDVLIGTLDHLLSSLKMTHLSCVDTLLHNVLDAMAVECFNQLLDRAIKHSRYVTWKRGVQLQFNLSRLEEWISKNNIYCQHRFELLAQAAKLMQLARTSIIDLAIIAEACSSLSISQIKVILEAYTPIENEASVSVELLDALDTWAMDLSIAAETAALVNKKTSTLDTITEHETEIELDDRPNTPTNLMHSEQRIKASGILYITHSNQQYEQSLEFSTNPLPPNNFLHRLPGGLWQLFVVNSGPRASV